MSFSGITVKQRSKEVEALKSFLAYSLIGSLALHFGVLSSGLGNYLTRTPEDNDEPVELAIVDAPTAKPEKPLEAIPEEPKKEPESIQKQSVETPPIEKVRQQFEQITAVAQKPQPTNTSPKAIVTKPEVPVKSASISRSPLSEDSKASSVGGGGGGGSGVGLGSGSGIAVGTSSSTSTGGGTGTGTGGGIGSGTGTGTGSGTGTGIGSGIGSAGTGIGSSIGSRISNETGNRPTVATAPTAPTPPKINSSSNGNGRAACRECNAKYPEAARRRGVEGRVEVAVDTDAQGNVTNVRIANSSGNRDLDEETLRQARNWKLKPAEGGRQGVSIATEFAIQGSRRHRQVEERNRQRQAQERTQQAASSNSNTTEGTSRRRRRELTSSSNEATATKPSESGLSRGVGRQRVETNSASSSSESRTTRSQGSARESLRRIRSERASSNSSQKPQTTTDRRRRRENTSQNKLRESLRRLRQQPQSQPTGPTQE
ncbi:TonB family protein [Nostoc sp. C117]|uniref:energy transducer TonB n=1 Tax=Nostoc sp. C117 TaxID=3349875 RepID=UPI00370D7708